jgi:hypothetical protein
VQASSCTIHKLKESLSRFVGLRQIALSPSYSLADSRYVRNRVSLSKCRTQGERRKRQGYGEVQERDLETSDENGIQRPRQLSERQQGLEERQRVKSCRSSDYAASQEEAKGVARHQAIESLQCDRRNSGSYCQHRGENAGLRVGERCCRIN